MGDVNQFIKDLRSRINYHRFENSLTYVEIVGALRLLQREMEDEALELEEEDFEY